MKRILSMMVCGCLAAGMLTGCGNRNNVADTAQEAGGAEEENTVEAVENTEVPGEETEPVEVKIWHDGDEAIMGKIEATVNEALKDQQISISFEKKSGLTDQLQLYGNDAANGPDLYFYAHDTLGTFVEMGIAAPISDVAGEDVFSGLLPMTVEAGTYKDVQYFMPVYFETLLFMYNKALWEGEVPETTEELYAYMEAHTDTGAGTYAVVNQHSTAYNVAPFINGFGGAVIDKNGQPGLNLAQTIEAVEYNKKFAAAIIGGPWLVSGIKEAGIDLGIKSLSDFKLPNGNGLAPFSGVQGVGVLKHAVDEKKDAIAQVLKVMAGREVGEALALGSNCAPANMEAYANPEVEANEMIIAIKETAETAQPMPNIPEMSVMWGPAEGLLAAVNKSGEDVKTAAERCQQDALTAIADMQ